MQHWSAGYVAYFPTYSLGAMYATQLYKVTPQRRSMLSSLGVVVMQHWSAGDFAYFPTYSLGAMYAVQLYKVTSN